jgi:hypothetical protein
MMERVEELFFTKNTYISAGYPPATKIQSGYFKGARVVRALGGSVTLVFQPAKEEHDDVVVYLTATDAYGLGKLLIGMAELASQELLENKLEYGER